MPLRDYQDEDLRRVRVALRSHRSVLLVQPTGAGKGTLAAHIVDTVTSAGRRVNFLVNRKTLVDDMSDRVTALGIPHGVIMGKDKRYNPERLCQVASIDTITRREDKPAADLLILDEARFSVTPTWDKVLDYYPQAKILGLDATPMRADGRGLGEVFETMVQGPSVADLIRKGSSLPAGWQPQPG
jgi:DNA repair protein RadD